MKAGFTIFCDLLANCAVSGGDGDGGMTALSQNRQGRHTMMMEPSMTGLEVQFATAYKPFDLKQVRSLPKYIFDDEPDDTPNGDRPFAQGLCWASYFVLVFTAITMFNAPARAEAEAARRMAATDKSGDAKVARNDGKLSGFELRGTYGRAGSLPQTVKQ